MKRVKVAPRSADWHAIRNESITASTAAVFFVKENIELLKAEAAKDDVHLNIEPLLRLGLESYFGNTLWTLWADKTGTIPRFRGNADTDRGVRNEDRVIDVLEATELIPVEREVTAVSSEMDWLLASFDGLVPSSADPAADAPYGIPVEAKCPAFVSRKKLWDSKKAGELAIMGLPYYWCQLQHQMLVANAPYAWFVAAGVEEDKDTGEEKVVFPIVEKVNRSNEVLEAYQAAVKFYYDRYILKGDEPPMVASDRELVEELTLKAEADKAIATGASEEVVQMYLSALREEEKAVKNRKTLEQKLLEAAKAMRTEGLSTVCIADRIEVIYSTRKTVSWQKIANTLVDKFEAKELLTDIMASATSVSETAKIKEIA